MTSSRRWLVISAAGLAVVAVAGATVWFVMFRTIRPDPLGRAQLRAGLEAQIATCSEPWARPPLAGAAKKGNAAMDQMAVVASMKGRLPDPQRRDPWLAAIHGDEALYAAYIVLHGAALDALQETVQRDHAWANFAIGEGLPTSLPPLGRHRLAFKLLLLRALREDTGACMRTIPIVVRLAQDVAAGNAIFGAVMLNRIFDDAAEVLNVCSRRAPKAELERARDELVELLRHPVSLGRAVQCELGLEMATLRDSLEVGVALDADEALTLWTMLLSASNRVAGIAAQDFPGAFDLFEAELSLLERARFGDGVIINYRKLFRDYVASYAYAQARLRAMIVSLEAQISGVRETPPAASKRAELADPFSGEALIFGHMSKCSVVWSIGQNRTNDSRVEGTRFSKNEDDAFVWACFEP